jgi:protein-S-isoprenylcysteine O-methyltransferase Ste14
MRDVLSLSTWRLHHWLIFLSSAGYLAVYSGIVPQPRAVMAWLASRPDVANSFSEQHFGRADAILLVFSTVFFGPLVLLLGLAAVLFCIAAMSGFLIPVVRWFKMPEYVANLISLGALAGVAYLESALWLPNTIWFLEILARACRVIIA